MKRNPKRCLRAYWGQDPDGPRGKKDMIFYSPDYQSNGGYLCSTFNFYKNPYGRTFLEELEARGFDITTLRFSVQLKEPAAS